MLESTGAYDYDAGGRSGLSTSKEHETSVTDTDAFSYGRFPSANNDLKDKSDSKPEMETDRKETPLLAAARNGITEVVMSILKHFPVAINDRNSEKKNVVLLAVDSRQPRLYKLLKQKYINESVFSTVDINGNSALHLAANYRKSMNTILGAALQMQWEFKWYEYVKSSMPPNFFMLYNKDGKTALEVFTETHKPLVKEGGEWLNKTSNSCLVVVGFIAPIAFATSVTVPGSTDKGYPFLEKEPLFLVFSISSLVSLCFSVSSLVAFLAILTSRYREEEFRMALPTKLLWAFLCLLISIAAVLVSFCTGNFFILNDQLKSVAVPIYAVTCLPVTNFALGQLPSCINLIRVSFMKVPTNLYNGRYALKES